MAVSRFGVSLEENLLSALDKYVIENRFANRSQAIRYLIERNLVEEKWKCDNIVAGAVNLTYANGRTDIRIKTSELSLEYRDVILSTQIFCLNTSNCLEIIAIKGPARKLTELADKLISIKGIQHGKLVMSKAE